MGANRAAVMGLQKCDLVRVLIPPGFAHWCLRRGRGELTSVILTLQQLHCCSAFSETLQKHLMKSSLRTALWDRGLLPLLLRGRTERER